MIHFYGKLQMPGSSGSLAIAVKPEDEFRFHTATILFCVTQNKLS
jgi:hypothetical protein